MSESSEALIIQAISEAKSGKKQAARKILSEVVVQEPNNADAWYLFSQVVEKPDEAIYCLDQVLSINPQDAKALKRIHQLKSSFTTSKSNGRMSKGIGFFPLSIITL